MLFGSLTLHSRSKVKCVADEDILAKPEGRRKWEKMAAIQTCTKGAGIRLSTRWEEISERFGLFLSQNFPTHILRYFLKL